MGAGNSMQNVGLWTEPWHMLMHVWDGNWTVSYMRMGTSTQEVEWGLECIRG